MITVAIKYERFELKTETFYFSIDLFFCVNVLNKQNNYISKKTLMS